MTDLFYMVTDEHAYESLEEAFDMLGCIAVDKEDALGWVIEVHNKQQAEHLSFINGQTIIERIQEQAYSEYSEYSDGYLEDVCYDLEKLKELENIISDWLNTNAEAPTFYQSSGLAKEIVVTEELLKEYGVFQ